MKNKQINFAKEGIHFIHLRKGPLSKDGRGGVTIAYQVTPVVNGAQVVSYNVVRARPDKTYDRRIMRLVAAGRLTCDRPKIDAKTNKQIERNERFSMDAGDDAYQHVLAHFYTGKHPAAERVENHVRWLMEKTAKEHA